MCGTNIIDHIFFPGLIVSIMVAFMDTKLVIIEGDGDGWSSIYHSVCWIWFFFFFFWGIQIFQKMTDSSYFRSNSSAPPMWRTDTCTSCCYLSFLISLCNLLRVNDLLLFPLVYTLKGRAYESVRGWQFKFELPGKVFRPEPFIEP